MLFDKPTPVMSPTSVPVAPLVLSPRKYSANAFISTHLVNASIEVCTILPMTELSFSWTVSKVNKPSMSSSPPTQAQPIGPSPALRPSKTSTPTSAAVEPIRSHPILTGSLLTTPR